MRSIRILFMIVILLVTFSGIGRADTTRVAVIGNSITQGSGLTSSLYSYPSQTGLLLGDSYIVFNFGVSGRTMLKKGDWPIWNEKKFKDALESNPDTVVILLGSNDAKDGNWQYGDEFLTDYIAMIDTLRQLPTNPEIYVCYPPPSFGDAFGIRNAVIADEIIPTIDKIVDSLSVSLIDFNTPFLDASYLFSDGVHPNADGAWEMAKILAGTLSGEAVNIEMGTDENLAYNKPVAANSEYEDFPASGLNDGNDVTKWMFDGFDKWAMINIGTLEEIDMFQINFGSEYFKSFQYIIEISSDSLGFNWTTVVDQSAREDTVTQISVDKIDPISARFVKITVTGASNAKDEITSISEFKILKSGFVHAPVLNWRLKSIFTSSTFYFLKISPTSYNGESIKYFQKINDAMFKAKIGFREAEEFETSTGIQQGQVHQYYTEAYKDGRITVSDTITITFDDVTSVKSISDYIQPELLKLQQNYPNPFNPVTNIRFTVPKPGKLSLKIYNVVGQEIATLSNKNYLPGLYNIQWNGKDRHGLAVPSGMYIYKLEANGVVKSKKMLLIK